MFFLLVQVVTKIKVQEVQVDSQKTLDALQACEGERDQYRTQLEESQSQHSQLVSLLEKEQRLTEQLSEEVNSALQGNLWGKVKSVIKTKGGKQCLTRQPVIKQGYKAICKQTKRR